MKRLFPLTLFLLPYALYGQMYTFRSKLVDESQNPIEAVTCMLLHKGGEYAKTVITDSVGVFTFTDVAEGDYLLSLSHLAYLNDTLSLQIVSDQEIPSITLYSRHTDLGNVVIRGEHPLVKSKDGKLTYDVPRLIRDRIADNAWEALQAVPHMVGGENLRLIGADEYAILIDGKATNLSKDQLISILKSTPSSKVKSIEIMYSAPPQYHVRGAAVNVILEGMQADNPVWQGAINTSYSQQHYASYKTRANLVYSRPNYHIDLTLGLEAWKNRNYSTMHARHSLEGSTYDIMQSNHSVPEGMDAKSQLIFDYLLPDKGKLSFTYTGEYGSYDSEQTSDAIYRKDDEPFANIHSLSMNDGNSQLHNLRIDYFSPRNLKIGGEYTLYRDPGTQKYNEYEEEVLLRRYKTRTKQKVNKATLYANHQFSTGNHWTINYGADFNFTTNNNNYFHYPATDALLPDSISLSQQKEYSGTIYAGFTKSFTDKFSVQASLSGNYFQASIDYTSEERKTLWNKFKPFVNANLTYTFSSLHMLQYMFSSDVKYPPYWALSPDVFQINAYSRIKGNPELKFSESYQSQLIYIFRNKYMLIGSYKQDNDYFTQLPYQSDDELVNMFRVENLDYRKTANISLVAPFHLSRIVQSKATLSYIYTKEKDSDFLSVPYTRSKTSWVGNLNNTIDVSSKPDIKMNIDAFYMNGYIQGVYDIHSMYSIDAGIKWTFCNRKAELSVKVTDLSGSMDNRTSIDFRDQWSRMTVFTDAPSFRLSFIYKFGGYKAKQTPDVDTSRFGRGN